MNDSLFPDALSPDDVQQYLPLAARMRPQTLDEFSGQEHILAPGRPLREALVTGSIHSMVLWGPPGVGKTTLAKLVAEISDVEYVSISAVLAGVKDIRAAVATAQQTKAQSGRKTLLFVDEVHRFNKAQQDAFLPYVEDGTIIFIGATTENPSFELNNALLSRVRTYVLKSLNVEALENILRQALADEHRGFGALQINYSPEMVEQLAISADGDARRALNWLELAVDLATEEQGVRQLDDAVIAEIIRGDVRRFDKGGDLFHEQISALHKSVRGSNPDASLYWFARMLDGGCEPLYIARRVVRMASEDIGNADPRGLQLALNAWDTQSRLGSPEGELALAQAVIYLACAPKSNAVYTAFNQVMADIRQQPSYEVPMHLRNAPTTMMKKMDYGAEYRYAHDEENAYAAGENYLPEEIQDNRYYFPVDRGLEAKIKNKLDYLRSLDKNSLDKSSKAKGAVSSD